MSAAVTVRNYILVLIVIAAQLAFLGFICYSAYDIRMNAIRIYGLGKLLIKYSISKSLFYMFL